MRIIKNLIQTKTHIFIYFDCNEGTHISMFLKDKNVMICKLRNLPQISFNMLHSKSKLFIQILIKFKINLNLNKFSYDFLWLRSMKTTFSCHIRPEDLFPYLYPVCPLLSALAECRATLRIPPPPSPPNQPANTIKISALT